MFEKVQKVIAEYKEMPTEEIQETTTFEELDLDSLDMVELIMQIEEKMGISVEIDEELKTVGDVVRHIEKA